MKILFAALLIAFMLYGCKPENSCGNEQTVDIELAEPFIFRDTVTHTFSEQELQALLYRTNGELRINVRVSGFFIGFRNWNGADLVKIIVDSTLRNTVVSTVATSTINIDRKTYPLHDSVMNSAYYVWMSATNSVPSTSALKTKQSNQIQCSPILIPHTLVDEFIIRIPPGLRTALDVSSSM
ncbi:MAG: hypothetical protein JNL32_08820 [Candidatus Kapabacteria bacterium]|nr:hypothetical protein [Candidatus Kapabacteria bacterium]